MLLAEEFVIKAGAVQSMVAGHPGTLGGGVTQDRIGVLFVPRSHKFWQCKRCAVRRRHPVYDSTCAIWVGRNSFPRTCAQHAVLGSGLWRAASSIGTTLSDTPPLARRQFACMFGAGLRFRARKRTKEGSRLVFRLKILRVSGVALLMVMMRMTDAAGSGHSHVALFLLMMMMLELQLCLWVWVWLVHHWRSAGNQKRGVFP